MPARVRQLVLFTRFFNWLAAAAVVAMMILTCADVILRFFRRPIPGTYELVGFLGALSVSFALAYTSLERGHIAVDLLIKKFPNRVRNFIDGINCLVSAALFAMITWQSVLEAVSLRESGEVSMTLQMPLYPIAFGIALGCGLLCILLAVRFIGILLRRQAHEEQ